MRRFKWFLFGLGTQLQLFGTSLSFTELFVFGAAVFLFAGELPHMRRNGMMPFLGVSIALVVNAVIACIANHSPLLAVIRGMAVVCLMPCTIVVAHWMLRRNMAGFKWYLIGVALSNFLCTFIFQRTVDVVAATQGQGDVAVAETIMSGPLWWVSQIGSWALLYPRGWYLQCPTLLSVCLPLGLAAFSLLTTASGRSAALGALGLAMLVLLGGKKREQIRKRVCKSFGLICIVGVVMVAAFKFTYQTAASQGWLGEESQKKYEKQTKGDTSVMALLLGGRMESFCGLIACVDKPISGFGPWARDTHGYCAEFLAKYGNTEDYLKFMQNQERMGSVGLIPGHAYLTMFWLWYGIMGLVFWIYVVFVFIRYLRQDCYAVPQWYMWLAAGIPGYCWGIFFSPWGNRVPNIVFVVAVLMVRAVRQGRQALPFGMQKEIYEIEHQNRR